jgi:hypothetical protein
MSDQVHATGPMYRPSRDDEQGIDAGTKRILYMMGAGGLVILAGIATYSLTGRSGSDVVPIVQADQSPMKVKPANPGGMAVGPEAKQIDPKDSRLAPGTEEPNPRALMAIGGPANGPGQSSVGAQGRSKPIIVQLSAAKTEAQAQHAWGALAKKMPDLFGQHHALYQKTNEPGQSAWRLRTGGFADQAQAKAFCDKVKAKGGQCSIVES